jgi:DNA replication protein DnaC
MKRIGEVLAEMSISVPIGARGGGRTAASPAPAYACPVCKDAGWVRHDVPIGHPFFGRLRECSCTLAKREDRQEQEKRQISNLDSYAFSRCTFDAFEHLPGTEDAFDIAYEFAQDPQGWLFLHGGCGVGKTHLAVAVALEQRERSNGNVIFAVVPDLLDHLRATFDPSNGIAYDERFTAIKDTYLLVLDDLGTENTTPWARKSSTRSLTTVTTSGCDDRHLQPRSPGTGRADRLRLLDRNLTRDVAIDAEDFRRRGRPDYVQGRGRSRRGR